MYVCICNAVTDHEIREAYAEGARSLSALQSELGVATCCGCCAPVAREVLAACQAEEEQTRKSPLFAVPGVAAAVAG